MTLREMRERAGLTLEDVGRVVGVGRGAVCYWEKGKSSPRIKVLDRLASLYGVSVQQILEAVKR